MLTPEQRRGCINASVLGILIGFLWVFPSYWYTKSEPGTRSVWLGGQTNLIGWKYRELPISQEAEAILVADRLINGEFSNLGGQIVRVFSAKRYVEREEEIGLFVHTPDRCWTAAGWTLQECQPEVRMIDLHGFTLGFERRVFTSGPQCELVYFVGLVGGQALPYRLDHNLSVGMKQALSSSRDRTGATLRAIDARFWSRIWNSFIARRRLIGPKQFIRLSTPILGGEVTRADELLESFMQQWLQAIDYSQELDKWKVDHPKGWLRFLSD